MASDRRWSPSFVFAVVLLASAIAGYVGWSLHGRDDVGRSERVVRDFSAAIAKAVGPLRRQLRRPSSEKPLTAAAIDTMANEAADQIDDLAEDASDAIESLGGISLKTQQNRLDRIDQRRAEAKAAISAMANEAKAALEKSGQ